jgi:hypothetical protein
MDVNTGAASCECAMSALLPIADIDRLLGSVRFVPETESRPHSITSSARTISVGETEAAGLRRSPMTKLVRRVFAGAESP